MSVVEIIGANPVFCAEVKKLSRTASCDASVLIIGETGTGKEVFARTIHHLGERSGKPFIPVNCGAIPVDLVENELFGHERGAYTGASISHVGLIGEAASGTLFLDEIDSLPLMAQVKLLRFLQEREYRPLGSSKTLRADVRIISASSTDLRKAFAAGQLRQDLFFRLNVVTINIPPLRERLEDIIPFAGHFLRRYALKFDKPAREFSQAAVIKLMNYHWPGNVR